MLFGFEEKVNLFKKLAEEDGLSHAYLFYGEPEVGKFTFAKSLAYFLEYSEFAISNRLLIDYQEIVPDPEKGSIGIDAVRQIKNFLFQKPFQSSRRLTVIDSAQVLTDEAQGALLKILEEPPSSAMVIVIVNEPSVLLSPLLSRLFKIYFPRMAAENLEKILITHCKISKEKARAAAATSFGRIGRALKLLKKEEKKAKEAEEPLEKYLSRKILGLYLDDKMKNASRIQWLLQKEWEASIFNLNPNLQRKAVELKINA